MQGGTSASKTISILMYLIGLAETDPAPTVTSIVSESFPHLKRGAMRDFQNILEKHHAFDNSRWNKTDCIYTFSSGSKIEFFSADQPDKVRGPRRDRLFINEANNVPYETFDQLEIRTSEFIFLDWNPVSEFWFYDLVKNRDDADFITLTYLDNEALDKAIVASIEQRKENINWWKVYGEGQLGTAEGRIYQGWSTIDEIPHEAKLVKRGLDFGYTNDPTALVDVYFYNGGYILDEIAYQYGMSNKQIADTILNSPEKAITMADSAEPKSIDEISSYKVLIQPALKGPDSVNQGIQFVKEQRISVTKRSLNLIKEYRNYMWATDRNGKALNVPEHAYSHSMDAIRYAIASEFPRRKTNDELKKIEESKELVKQFDARRRKNVLTGSPTLRKW